ncbi:MAG: hypothetical protein P4L50_03330 [Anaerolineaceae bacterium]|nr:hypothetical protein [Anaerolineaceae bacterium]
MASNPLRLSIQSAVQANTQLGDLFAHIGNSDHPGGIITTAYRNAQAGIKTALQNEYSTAAVRDQLEQLRQSVQGGVTDALTRSQILGASIARKQLDIYGYSGGALGTVALSTQLHSAASAITSKTETQIATATAMLQTGADPGLIVGDDERQGVIRSGEILIATAFWLATLNWDAYSDSVSQANGNFQKQAIAALDNKTTDCCLQVHGQIQDMDNPFQLDGEPRFADELDWAPFHWWCRTSISLYLPGYDDGITDDLLSSAQTVMDERKSGIWKDRSPADAYS